MTARETIYSALFDRLSAAMPAYFATRDLVPYPPDRWPTMVVTAKASNAADGAGWTDPTIWRLGAEVYLYVERRGAAQPFEPTIHAAIDAIVVALAPQPGEASYGDGAHTTLGGLVLRAAVRGNVEIHREPGDQRAALVIPVEMLAY